MLSFNNKLIIIKYILFIIPKEYIKIILKFYNVIIFKYKYGINN